MLDGSRISRRSLVKTTSLLGVGLMFPRGNTLANMNYFANVQVSAAEWHRRKEQAAGPPRPFQGAVGTLAYTTVGSMPQGYGASFEWDRKEKRIAIAAFVNSADPLGVCVSNLKKGDFVRVTSASGICSTNDGSGSPISSIIGAVAAAGSALFPEAAPFIAIGKQFADATFKKSNNSDPRDAFGQDPTNGDWCQDEGGILVCLPSAGGIYYATSGIKTKTPRYPDTYPDHVKDAFFLLRHRREPVAAGLPFVKDVSDENVLRAPHNINADGELFIVTWDSDYPDNQGYYEVHLTIERP